MLDTVSREGGSSRPGAHERRSILNRPVNGAGWPVRLTSRSE
jgi:hypothetical protein